MVSTCGPQHRLDCRSSQAEYGCSEKTWQANKKWDKVLVKDRKKLGMDSVDTQYRSKWRGRLRGRLVKQA